MNCQRFPFRAFLQRFINRPDDCELFAIVERLPAPTPDGPWIAGGAIRRTVADQPLESDVDYFFRDADQRLAFETRLLANGATTVSRNQHVATFSVQVEKRRVLVQAISIGYYESPEAVLDSFDFTITQFAYDGADLICGEFALWDLARRRLALHRLTYGVSTVRRMIKYSRQGFTACAGAIASILEQTVAQPDVIQSGVEYID